MRRFMSPFFAQGGGETRSPQPSREQNTGYVCANQGESMSTQPIDYAAILADLEAKKIALEAAIASVRAAIVAGTLGQSGDSMTFSAPGLPAALTGGEIPAGAFLGKSIPDAAKLYLEIVKKKQTSKEIAEALLKGGMESTSKNFPSIVHAILDRARKAKNPALVKVDKSDWGLTGWWPKGIGSANGTQSKKPTKKKAAKKAKAEGKSATSSSAHQSAPTIVPKDSSPKQEGTNAKRIMDVLLAKPGAELGFDEIAKQTGITVRNVGLIVSNFMRGKKPRVEKTSSGKIRAVSATKQAVA
jgi:hypothetical protein